MEQERNICGESGFTDLKPEKCGVTYAEEAKEKVSAVSVELSGGRAEAGDTCVFRASKRAAAWPGVQMGGGSEREEDHGGVCRWSDG